MDRVRVGIIGTGKAGFLFGKAVIAASNGELVSLAAATEAEAKDAGDRLGGVPQCTGDWKALLANPDVDAVFICSPTFLHAEMTIAAAMAGKHVLCDKPMCLSVKEADAMIAACDKAGVVFMIGFVERFNAAFRVMKQRIKDGKIGEPVMCNSRRAHPPRKGSWIMDDKQSGGAFLHTGCHNIDLVQWLFDRPVTHIQSVERESGISPGFTDVSTVMATLDNGIIITQVESYAHPTSQPMGVDRSFEILGTGGSLYLDLLRSPVTLCNEDGWQYQDCLTWVEADGQLSGALTEETEYFLACVQRGEQPTEASAIDGKRTLAVFEAAKKAAVEHRRVEVEVAR